MNTIEFLDLEGFDVDDLEPGRKSAADETGPFSADAEEGSTGPKKRTFRSSAFGLGDFDSDHGTGFSPGAVSTDSPHGMFSLVPLLVKPEAPSTPEADPDPEILQDPDPTEHFEEAVPEPQPVIDLTREPVQVTYF